MTRRIAPLSAVSKVIIQTWRQHPGSMYWYLPPTESAMANFVDRLYRLFEGPYHENDASTAFVIAVVDLMAFQCSRLVIGDETEASFCVADHDLDKFADMLTSLIEEW